MLIVLIVQRFKMFISEISIFIEIGSVNFLLTIFLSLKLRVQNQTTFHILIPFI